MIKSADFYFEGGRAGVLLIHGLTGTPNEMRTVGKGLHRAGFTVYGMQLAGHCGDVDDLVRTGWKDWYASVLEGVDRLRRDVDHCFVAGLSMGAVLALKAAADRPDDIAGVGVYGATFRYDGWNIPWYWRLSFLLPWFKRFNLFQDKTFDEEPPYGLKDERLRAAVSSSMLGGDSADAGLPGNPWSSLAELIDLSATVRRQLPQVRAPCLVMHAAEDDMASVGNARLVMNRVSGPAKLVLLHDSYHMITVDRERREVIRESAEFFSEIAARREDAAPPGGGAMTPLVALLWALNVLVDTGGQLAFKAAATTPAEGRGLRYWRELGRRPWIWIGIACYILEFVVWLAFLSLVPLSEGVLLGSINIVAIMIAGRFLFNEHLTPLRVAGIALIAAGVAVVGIP